METELTYPAPLQSIGKLMAGLFFAVAGVLLTAANLDLFDVEPYLRLWPAVLIVAGVFKVLDAHGSRPAGVALIVAGSWLLAGKLGLIHFSIFDLWPLVLVLGGLAFIVRAFRGETTGAADGTLAMWSDQKVEETSRDYRGGNRVAFMGRHVIDLSRADITTAPAVLDVFAWWGGIEITVPDDWDVVGDVTTLMAGFELRNGARVDPKRRLIIRGTAIMSGIEVKSVARRTA